MTPYGAPIHNPLRPLCYALTFMVALLLSTGLSAAQPLPTVPQAPALAPQPVVTANATPVELPPIALTDIPSKAAAERPLLDQANLLLGQSAEFNALQKNLTKQNDTINQALRTLDKALVTAVSRNALTEIESNWLRFEQQMTQAESTLHNKTVNLEQHLNALASRLEIWKKTVHQARIDQAPNELVKLASDTVKDINLAYTALQNTQNEILTLQGKLGRTHRAVQEALDKIKAEESNLFGNLQQRDHPALWNAALASLSLTDLLITTGAQIATWWSTLTTIIQEESDRLVLQFFLFLLASFALFNLRKTAQQFIIDHPTVTVGDSIFEKPYALAILSALLLTPWLYASSSSVLMDAMGLLLIAPVLWLMLPFLDAPIRPALFFLAALYVVDWLRDLVESDPTVTRIIFIIEMLATIGLIVWLIKIRAFHGSSSRWQMLIRLGLKLALFLLVVSIITAITGYVRLSALIGYAVLNSAYLAVLLAALIRAADAILALTLYSSIAQSVRVVAARTEKLNHHLNKLLGIVFIFIWVKMTLEAFTVWDSLVGFFDLILFTKLHAGSIEISLVDVLLFFLTIWLSIFLARLITTILDEDVYQRVALGRGVSFAISSVIKYSIIVLGFLLAISAMGIGMDRITILIGALSVGIGFGLQTIVNNFISGMILIFERPIQIGDSIEIGTVKGVITRMGIRSSTVRSFEGAEVTVPNGTLLSDSVTNWTLTDRNRRIEIPIGVAYDSDPDKVIEALRNALYGQEGILSAPESQVLLTGFGDNGLNFLLRAWVADNDDHTLVRSNVALAINRELKHYGIEIPYPQRDVRLRSMPENSPINDLL